MSLLLIDIITNGIKENMYPVMNFTNHDMGTISKRNTNSVSLRRVKKWLLYYGIIKVIFVL